MKNGMRLVKAAAQAAPAIQQRPGRVRFTNWAVQFKIEQAARPNAYEQFRSLFKETPCDQAN